MPHHNAHTAVHASPHHTTPQYIPHHITPHRSTCHTSPHFTAAHARHMHVTYHTSLQYMNVDFVENGWTVETLLQLVANAEPKFHALIDT